MIDVLLAALHHAPDDDVAWLALADALEEADDARAELTRLTLTLRRPIAPRARRKPETRLREILASGVDPCVPTLTVSHGIPLTLIPPGLFTRGAKRGEHRGIGAERPRRMIEITRPFYLGTYLITQAQFLAVIGRNPSTFRPNPRSHYDVPFDSTDDFPVDSVRAEDAEEFCERLSRRQEEKRAGRVYRLPTEAEWEYACRAGTTTIFHFGETLTGDQANFDGNYSYGDRTRPGVYLHRTCPVGQYRPNAFGLYDMHGNLWEWCNDHYDPTYYRHSPAQDPPGPASETQRVLRGGSWIDAGWNCRSATRSHREALHYVGFRVAMTLECPSDETRPRRSRADLSPQDS